MSNDNIVMSLYEIEFSLCFTLVIICHGYSVRDILKIIIKMLASKDEIIYYRNVRRSILLYLTIVLVSYDLMIN